MASQFSGAENMLEVAPAAQRSAGESPFTARISSVVRRIGDYVDAMANYYAAAAIYEQLYRLSNAELRRRGLSRENLARDVLAAWDRPARPD
jgi:hypothetical protein